ncbi:hypothetical protein ScPMuIL_007329, partial [Solemya velum]
FSLKYNILKLCGSGGIRTHASEETGALNQRLRPVGHARYVDPGLPPYGSLQYFEDLSSAVDICS